MKKIKVSVIVASYNSEKNINKTIESIEKQLYESLEIIFIDGGSTDRTLEIINSYDIMDRILISEPDKGIGDAWNKGLMICTGDIIGILNSDDFWDLNVLHNIVTCFDDFTMPLIGYGDVTLVDRYGNFKEFICGKKRGRLGLLNGFGFLHPSVFFNRKAYEINGLFNPKISVAMDNDWLLRAIDNGIPFKKIPSHTFMLTGGLSHLSKYTGMGEYMDSLLRNGYSRVHILIFFMLRFLGSIADISRGKS